MLRPGNDRKVGSICGGVAENALASRTPSHGCGGIGAANRWLPTGGAAKGIPLNTTTPCSYLPRTAPLLVEITGSCITNTFSCLCFSQMSHYIIFSCKVAFLERVALIRKDGIENDALYRF